MRTIGIGTWRRWAVLFAGVAAMLGADGAMAAPKKVTITLMSTTSTENSGLLGYLMPKFEVAHGIKVNVVAYGTGQALRAGRRGDADVLLVHDKNAELKFMADGHGVNRRADCSL